MCAYNEERTIVSAVNSILDTDFPCEFELVVVDDGSTDATPVLLGRLKDRRLTVHRHRSNRGKGAALKTAASLATGAFILPFDADLEYSAEDIPKILAPVLSGRCEVVYGVRLFGLNTVYQSYRYALGNRFLTNLANVLFDAYISDLHTCLKLMPLATFRRLNLTARGFGLDTEVTASMLRMGIRPFEVPVSYYSRPHSQGKKITWRDGFACLGILIRVRFARASRLTSEDESSQHLEPLTLIAPEQPRPGLAHAAVLVMNTESDGIGATAAN